MTSRVQLLLAGLAAVGAVATVTMRMSPASPATPGAAPVAAAAQAPSLATVADVKLDLLQQPHDALNPPGRDPFRFPVVAQPRPVAVAAPIATPPPAPVFTGPPPPPPIPLRYIGVIETAQQLGRVALLSDGRGGLMQGREGDIIEGRFRVLKVGVDSIELAYADGRGRQTIRLSGQ
jgi:hypothetical protein